MIHMTQKYYEWTLVDCLRKQPAHIRELARVCGFNQMAVLRSMHSLERENVVDYQKEGKNKVYFLKDTEESRQYLFIAEHFKLIQIIKKHPHLRNIIHWIQEKKEICLAVLFGSYAKSSAHEESDIDVYIETKNRKFKEELESLNTKLSVKIGFFNEKSILWREIEKHHILIKGVERYYENAFAFPRKAA